MSKLLLFAPFLKDFVHLNCFFIGCTVGLVPNQDESDVIVRARPCFTHLCEPVLKTLELLEYSFAAFLRILFKGYNKDDTLNIAIVNFD